MKIRIDPAALVHSRWSGHALRFILGGGVTVVAGVVANELGPKVGGFFLAFPAILPAALILSEKLQNEQLQGAGRGLRGRHAVVVGAAGAATGSVALVAFAAVTWCLLGRLSAPISLSGATAAWLVVALLAWLVRKR